jgi:hypothetical protein
MTSPLRSWLLAAVLAALGAVAAQAADVTLDGVVVPKASATMTISVPITQYRDGASADQCPRLLPLCPKPEVCNATPGPIARIDAQLAGAAPVRFTVGVEDGRLFSRCLPASLETKGGRLRKSYSYCLRCEGVTGP